MMPTDKERIAELESEVERLKALVADAQVLLKKGVAAGRALLMVREWASEVTDDPTSIPWRRLHAILEAASDAIMEGPPPTDAEAVSVLLADLQAALSDGDYRLEKPIELISRLDRIKLAMRNAVKAIKEANDGQA